MGWLTRGLGSTVGTKLLVAGTGLFLVLFVLGHMLGNLQVFLGPEALNAYAAKLQGLGGGLWVVRAVLLAIVLVHVTLAVRLQILAWRARPVPYLAKKPLKSTVASRTMIWSGILVLSFIVFHLLHFTVHATHPEYRHLVDAAGRHDVYGMVVLGFRQAPVALAYAVAMLLLGFHLLHGIASIFQTLGWNPPRYRGLFTRLGQALALLVVVGNVSMPLLILSGAVGGN